MFCLNTWFPSNLALLTMGQIDKLNLCFSQVNKISDAPVRLGDRKRQLTMLLRGRLEAKLMQLTEKELKRPWDFFFHLVESWILHKIQNADLVLKNK